MPYNAAGNFSPIALEPYNIENTLAPLAAAGSPATARLLLSQYGLERDANKNLYTDEINNQRAMGYAALHQQMVDRAVKTMADAAQHPEMAPYLFGSQYGQEAMGPGDPQAYHQLQTNLGTAASLGRAKTAAEVIQAGSAGGGAPDLGQLSAATGLTFNPSVATSVQAAAARNAGQIRQGPHMMVPVPSGETDENGKPQYVQVPVPVDATPEEVQAIIAQARRNMGQVTGGQPNVPGAPPDPRAAKPAPRGPVDQNDTSGAQPFINAPVPPALQGGIGASPIPTGLRPPPPGTTYAQPDTSSGGGAQAAPVTTQPTAPTRAPQDTPTGKIESWQTPQGQALQGKARQGLSTLSESSRQDVLSVAGKIGGIIPIRVIGGVPQYIGKNGNPVGPVP